MSRKTDSACREQGCRASERRREEAARWFVMLDSAKLSSRALERWRKWEAVPENRQAFDSIVQTWRCLGRVPWPPVSGAAERAADAYTGVTSVSSWIERQRTGRVAKHD